MPQIQLFQGSTLRFTALDFEKDSTTIASWTKDLDIARMFRSEPLRPLTSFEIKKWGEKGQKEYQDKGQPFLFAVRRIHDNELVGILQLSRIQWTHGNAEFNLIFGSTEDWGELGQEGLNMALRYAFHELNLFRIKTPVNENDHAAVVVFEKSGFTLEIRRRQALYRDGKLWDELHFGMLLPEWEHQQMEVAA